GPGVKHHSDTTDAILNVTDIVPTILDFADARHPSIKPNSHLAALWGKIDAACPRRSRAISPVWSGLARMGAVWQSRHSSRRLETRVSDAESGWQRGLAALQPA